MTNTRTNNSSKKKLGIIMVGLLLVIGIMIGSLFAFFSDVVTVTGNATTGTLALANDANFYINGSSTPATDEELACINPGDSIKAVVSITNEGSKSAWLQNSFVLSAKDGAGASVPGSQLSGAFTVYEGTDTGAAPLNGVSDAAALTFTDDGTNVIDGSYEKETGTPPSGVTFIEDVAKDYIFTIVFDKDAGNFWQTADISLGYEVSALQYRNNPTPVWSDALPNAYNTSYGIN